MKVVSLNIQKEDREGTLGDTGDFYPGLEGYIGKEEGNLLYPVHSQTVYYFLLTV